MRRKSIPLREAEVKAIRTAGSLNKNTIVTLVCGSMILTRDWEDSVSAILYSWYSGMEGGRALANILFGDVNPSGKLPFAIPEEESHLPQVDFFHANEIWYDFDHGYRKLDRDGHKPAYPFGYGMSYTTFTYAAPELTKTEDEVVLRIPVTNTGKIAGTEIVQVYVSVPKSNVERHVRELKGFVRVDLQVGETRTAEIHIPIEELKYYNEETGSWILEQTGYEFQTGPCADPESLQTVNCQL